MNEAIITLRIKYEPNYGSVSNYVRPPDTWDWRNILQLENNEEVVVISQNLVMIGDEEYKTDFGLVKDDS